MDGVDLHVIVVTLVLPKNKQSFADDRQGKRVEMSSLPRKKKRLLNLSWLQNFLNLKVHKIEIFFASILKFVLFLC